MYLFPFQADTNSEYRNRSSLVHSSLLYCRVGDFDSNPSTFCGKLAGSILSILLPLNRSHVSLSDSFLKKGKLHAVGEDAC